MTSNYIGHEISYSLKGSSSTIIEYIYADSSSAALNIVKQKYPKDSFVYGPTLTGGYKKSQRQLDFEADEERRKQDTKRRQDRANNLSPEELAKKEKADEGLVTLILIFFGLGFILFILYHVYILFLNVISFKTISNYDIGLYADNIIHFERPYYQRTTQNLKAIIVNPEELRNNIVVIKKNNIVVNNGHKNLENNVTARAISYYTGTTNVFAYIKTKNTDVKPLVNLDSNASHYIRLKIKNLFVSKLNKEVKITKSDDNNLTQQLENKGYEIIDRLSNEHTSYLYRSKDEDTVNEIENIYYDEERYDKLFMQIGNKYLQSSR